MNNSDGLLAIGSSNWNYHKYVFSDGATGVMAIAKKDSGASDCYFGPINHFIKCYRNRSIGSLTSLGEKIVYRIK